MASACCFFSKHRSGSSGKDKSFGEVGEELKTFKVCQERGDSGVCDNDVDCEQGKYCRNIPSLGMRCQPRGTAGVGESCENSGDCAESFVCRDSVCIKKDGSIEIPSAPTERGIFTRGLTDDCLTIGKCNTCDILVVVNNIISFVLEIVGGLAVLVLVVAGVLYITSQGNPEQVQHAKAAVTAAIIGTLIVLGTWLIITIIVETLGSTSIEGPWYRPSC